MCFVSFIPQPQGFLLGSNRDEHKARKSAMLPEMVETRFGKLAMPVDGKAGGTWIALRQDGVAVVLLNGAFENHVREGYYRHSRGVIIPQIMESVDPNAAFADFYLDQIEPFTLITVLGHQLTEWRWDGQILHCNNKDASNAHCWSSATLYDAQQQAIRRQWFMDALNTGIIYDAESLMRWQSVGGYGPKHTDIVLERADGIGTVSTTVLSSLQNVLEISYEDFLKPGSKKLSFPATVTLHEKKEFLQKAY